MSEALSLFVTLLGLTWMDRTELPPLTSYKESNPCVFLSFLRSHPSGALLLLSSAACNVTPINRDRMYKFAGC